MCVIRRRYSPLCIPVSANLPDLSVIVKLTSEESFLRIKVIVALVTGCLATVSTAIPVTAPFFCADAREPNAIKNKHRLNRLIAVVFYCESIFRNEQRRLTILGLMLMKVNKLFRRANSEPLGIRVLGYKENSRIHER